MKSLVFTALFLIACTQTNATLDRWARDELYCWYKNDNGQWVERGLASECPIGASAGGPVGINSESGEAR